MQLSNASTDLAGSDLTHSNLATSHLSTSNFDREKEYAEIRKAYDEMFKQRADARNRANKERSWLVRYMPPKIHGLLGVKAVTPLDIAQEMRARFNKAVETDLALGLGNLSEVEDRINDTDEFELKKLEQIEHEERLMDERWLLEKLFDTDQLEDALQKYLMKKERLEDCAECYPSLRIWNTMAERLLERKIKELVLSGKAEMLVKLVDIFGQDPYLRKTVVVTLQSIPAGKLLTPEFVETFLYRIVQKLFGYSDLPTDKEGIKVFDETCEIWSEIGIQLGGLEITRKTLESAKFQETIRQELRSFFNDDLQQFLTICEILHVNGLYPIGKLAENFKIVQHLRKICLLHFIAGKKTSKDDEKLIVRIVNSGILPPEEMAPLNIPAMLKNYIELQEKRKKKINPKIEQYRKSQQPAPCAGNAE